MESYHPDGYNDVLIEEEDSVYAQEASPPTTWNWELLNPMIYVNYLLEFLASYGWYVLAAAMVAVYFAGEIRARYRKLQQKWEDAEYHKDPDKALARMEAIQRAREAQQRRLEEASQRERERQEELAAKKRQEALERLEKYGSAAGQRLGGENDDLPLSRGASSSSYRPPKRSKCGGGGCGR